MSLQSHCCCKRAPSRRPKARSPWCVVHLQSHANCSSGGHDVQPLRLTLRLHQLSEAVVVGVNEGRLLGLLVKGWRRPDVNGRRGRRAGGARGGGRRPAERRAERGPGCTRKVLTLCLPGQYDWPQPGRRTRGPIALQFVSSLGAMPGVPGGDATAEHASDGNRGLGRHRAQDSSNYVLCNYRFNQGVVPGLVQVSWLDGYPMQHRACDELRAGLSTCRQQARAPLIAGACNKCMVWMM